MKLSKFNEFALTSSEMKAVRGGTITCTCVYEWGSETGSCSGPSTEACAGYACSGGGINIGCNIQ